MTPQEDRSSIDNGRWRLNVDALARGRSLACLPIACPEIGETELRTSA